MSIRHHAALFAASLLTPFAATATATDAPGEGAIVAATNADESATVDDTDPIVITGKREGYGTDAIATATKTNTRLTDLPQSVTVVTEEQIADQALRSVGDVVRYVPGIAMESGEGHRDAIVIRGQLSTADFFTDGLRDDVQHYRGLYNVEQVEVLKGPNALVFGRGGSGGIVNRVTKRPFSTGFYTGAASLDSEGSGFVEIDLNRPLTTRFDGRLNATYERIDDFRDVSGDRFAVNPTLAFYASPATRIDIGYEYAEDERGVDRGLPPAFDGTFANPARAIRGADELFFGDRDVNRATFDKHVVNARVEHSIAEGIEYVGKALYGDYDKLYRNAVPSSAVTLIDGVESVKISAYEDATQRTNFLVQNDLVARFETGAIGHTLLVGADYGRQDTSAGRLRGFFDTLDADRKSPNGRETFVPIADPVVIPPLTFRGGSGERASETDVTAFGLYVQDQVEIGDHVELIGGLRHDWVDIRVADFIGGTDLSRDDSLWSPRAGVVVKPTDTLNIYASWSRSYLPQSGDQFASLSPSDAALEPEKFTNRELGVKYSAMPGLDLTAAVYRLDRTNVRAQAPDSVGVLLTGEQRAEGIELGVNGKLGALSLAGGIAFQDAEITRTTEDAPAGRQVANLPDVEASLWGRYDLDARYGVGLGVSHRGDYFASISNEVVVDPVTRVDAAFFASLTDRIALQVNAENIFGEEGIEFAHGDNNLHPVKDRSVRVTLRFEL